MRAGHGDVVGTLGPGGTRVSRLRATSPLRLIASRGHGHAAWVFGATLGGGLVAGDHVSLRAHAAPGATLLLSTQSSTKVYRAKDDGLPSRQSLDATVERDGLLVVLPDPVVCFAGARYAQRQRVRLAEGASVLLVDAFTCGRRAYGERWAMHGYAARTELVSDDGAPLVVDAVVLDPRHGDLSARMGRTEAMATIVAAGPRATHAADVLTRPSPLAPRAGCYVSGGLTSRGAIVVRVAADEVRACAREIQARLAWLEGALGDDPFARKW